ncbi:RidA family protein [Bradyrhizobium australiense]|uniref:RidA family protein n=1 Tax=Bradyrhizobium australiense TaxID=2721161 RepID=A0A7Y4M083_9BRAD|nr:RidA family protein [Bradyrhizobium australiense]NOJ44595.1 RidA family protein [Bradyrhizobium australiense]
MLDPTVTWREAVFAGDLVFVSGQFGLNIPNRSGEGESRQARVAAQTRQSLKNIAGVLAENGLTVSDVVRCTVSLASADDYNSMNEEYAKVFPTNQPARTTVAVQLLVSDALVEIDCVAYRKRG